MSARSPGPTKSDIVGAFWQLPGCTNRLNLTPDESKRRVGADPEFTRWLVSLHSVLKEKSAISFVHFVMHVSLLMGSRIWNGFGQRSARLFLGFAVTDFYFILFYFLKPLDMKGQPF